MLGLPTGVRACLFDLDGVLTQTAKVHAAAWKEMFDGYLRERAAALLKVADGMPAARVARTGLLRPRKPDTVYAWIDRFIEAGSAGLQIQAGRGRKPAFSPLAGDAGVRAR